MTDDDRSRLHAFLLSHAARKALPKVREPEADENPFEALSKENARKAELARLSSAMGKIGKNGQKLQAKEEKS